ncbi:hypothetical protein [Paraoerskovia marina]|uniref:hypothetical protein n=1 Tax=Paraoerskovia marina TaxID=545619 RepID=UPI0012DF3FB3|nr:hypothetical protein [Paraoerskovia marina]
MQITLDHVRVDGRREPMLETIDLTLATGSVVLVAAEPGHGHTALALVATGRLRPDEGTVTFQSEDLVSADPADLRDASAVVDASGISEPDDALTVADVVAEGLSLAGRRSWPVDVTRWLAETMPGLDRRSRVDALLGTDRTALMTALAVTDPRVRVLVVVAPDRHGGNPAGWWDLAVRYAEAGYGVLVTAARSSVRLLGHHLESARDDDAWHAPPVVVATETPTPSVSNTPAEDLA